MAMEDNRRTEPSNETNQAIQAIKHAKEQEGHTKEEDHTKINRNQ